MKSKGALRARKAALLQEIDRAGIYIEAVERKEVVKALVRVKPKLPGNGLAELPDLLGNYVEMMLDEVSRIDYELNPEAYYQEPTDWLGYSEEACADDSSSKQSGEKSGSSIILPFPTT